MMRKDEQHPTHRRLQQYKYMLYHQLVQILASRHFYSAMLVCFVLITFQRARDGGANNTVVIPGPLTSIQESLLQQHKNHHNQLYMGNKEKNTGWSVDTLCLQNHQRHKRQQPQPQTPATTPSPLPIIAYGFGAGLDISWDLGMVDQLGIDEMHIFDPTEKSRKYVQPILQQRQQQQQNSENLNSNTNNNNGERHHTQKLFFTPIGLSTTKGTISFALPANTDHVSMRSVHLKDSDMTQIVSAPVNTLSNFMQERQHEYLDVFKLDIEGAEYEVLEDLIEHDFLPFTQLLIEYHQRFLSPTLSESSKHNSSLRKDSNMDNNYNSDRALDRDRNKDRHQNVIRGLQAKGFVEIWNQNNHQEVGYVKVADLAYCTDGISPRSAHVQS